MEASSTPASVDDRGASKAAAAAPVDRATSAPADVGDVPGYRIRVVSDPWLERLLIAAPIGVAVVLVWFGFFRDDPMFGSGLLTVIAAFVVFHVFAGRIPDAFDRLLARGVVVPADASPYRAFEAGIEKLMNGRLGLIPGIVFALFAIARFPTVAGGIDRWLLGDGVRSLARAGPLMLADMIAEALLGFALGLVLWRMLVVARKVSDVGRRFDLELQLNHPDRCGGFRPLGDLCLWNALLVTVPAIFLATWVVLAPGIPRYGTTYVGLHTAFLGVLAVLAPVTFLAPLWTIHQTMVREGARLRVEVEQLGQQINSRSRSLLERSDEMTPDEIAALAKDVEVRQASYKTSEKIPTWPIDLGLAFKFGTSQIIPLLSLTGLSKPVVDTIDRLAKFIEPS
jgi:hypothetical protein